MTSHNRVIRRIGRGGQLIAFCVALMLSTSNSSAQSSVTSTIGDMAKQFSGQLFSSTYCLFNRQTTIGLWPFDEATLPIDRSSARRIYSDLLSALLKQSPGCVEYIDGDGVNVTIGYLNRVGALKERKNRPLDEIEKQLKSVDLIAAVNLYEQGGDILLELKATERSTGKTKARVSPMVLPSTKMTSGCQGKTLSLEASVDRATRYFRDNADDMRTLVMQGILYQDTRTRTALSQFVLSRLRASISAAYTDVLTERRLVIRDPGARSGQDFRMPTRGMTVQPKALDPRVSEADGAPSSTIFELSGQYWPCADSIELTLVLQNRDGQSVDWRGRVSRASFPESLAIEPRKTVQPKTWGPSGAFGFRLTTPRGRNPVYQAGERARVIAHLDRDAWLYCFYTDVEGQVTQILPNVYQNRGSGGRFFRGGKVHYIPDPDRDPFELILNESTVGAETLRCFATSRDVTGKLPVALQGKSDQPLPVRYATRMQEIFENLPSIILSQAQMTITVEKPN